MSVPIRSTTDILAALREHPEWKEELRRELLTEDLLELPATVRALAESQRRTEATLESFMESTRAFERSMEEFRHSMEEFKESTEKRLDSLESTLRSFMEATEKRLDSLESTLRSFMEATEKRLDSLESTLCSFMESTEKRLRGVERELDHWSGKSMESDTRKKLGNYLRGKVRKAKGVEGDLATALIDVALDSGQLSEEEGDDLGDADVLAAGKDRETGEVACVAIEVSKTVDEHDVERAARRAVLFLKAGRAAVAQEPREFLDVFPAAPEKAYALVVGRRITHEGRREAERKGVLFAKYRNGYDREG